MKKLGTKIFSPRLLDYIFGGKKKTYGALLLLWLNVQYSRHQGMLISLLCSPFSPILHYTSIISLTEPRVKYTVSGIPRPFFYMTPVTNAIKLSFPLSLNSSLLPLVFTSLLTTQARILLSHLSLI